MASPKIKGPSALVLSPPAAELGISEPKARELQVLGAISEKALGEIVEHPKARVACVGAAEAFFAAIATLDLSSEEFRRTAYRFLEFFTVPIENDHTRRAYARAVRSLLAWCEEKRLSILSLTPMSISAYLAHLGRRHKPPTVKQHLSGIRHLFDWLVTGHALPYNPASAVRGPKHVVSAGKTPVLFKDDARKLFEAIDTSHVVGLRDRAILGVMTYSFARVGAVVKMNVRDYYSQGRRAWFILREKGGKHRRVPAHHKAVEFVDAYLEAAEIAGERDAPLFRTAPGRARELTERRMGTNTVLEMVKRRAEDAGLPPEVCCHTFRGTGITDYLKNGGQLETAAGIAGHASTRTTQLYYRAADEFNLDEIEKIQI